MSESQPQWLEREGVATLLAALQNDGYRVVGPTVDGAAIVYDDIATIEDLPIGWTDEQAPGRYRLAKRDDDSMFGFVVGPHSWKQFLLPPRETLVQIRKRDSGTDFESASESTKPMAFIGVRACELAAIEVQDRVFVKGPFIDPRYAKRREDCLIIAVNCIEAGELCFCHSMNTGPKVGPGYDICLTEVDGGLVAEAGSEVGAELLTRAGAKRAEAARVEARDAGIETCKDQMGRFVDTTNIAGLLFGNLEHHRWNDVAERCLSCGNCTLVCPTCFCFNVEDKSLLSDVDSTRERSWDSCFTQDHSTIHGAEFRPTIKDRYRQWLTHKVASWESQFDTSGCVGCGRCIAWCPVGIDMTEELGGIRDAVAKPAIEMPRATTWEKREGDPLVPVPVRVSAVRRENADTVSLLIDRPSGGGDHPGQFNMLSLPAIGDVPISISGSDEGSIEHTIRSVGHATEALCNLRPGDTLGLRGPFGTHWPIDECKGHPVTLIAGGVGLAPLRSTMRLMASDPGTYPSLQLLYGARSPDDILFDSELLGWDSLSHCDVSVTVDHGSRHWVGNIGFVTSLMRRKALPSDGRYLICGPEVMMRQVLNLLHDAGVPEAHCYVSMERNMKCAAGFCGRCQYGPYFVCKDGPVFRYDKISFLFGRPGF